MAGRPSSNPGGCTQFNAGKAHRGGKEIRRFGEKMAKNVKYISMATKPAHFRKALSKGENLIFNTKPHLGWLLFWKVLKASITFLIFYFIIFGTPTSLSNLLERLNGVVGDLPGGNKIWSWISMGFAGLLIYIYLFLSVDVKRTTYAATNEKLIIKDGDTWRFLMLTQIESVHAHQSWWERRVDEGELHIWSKPLGDGISKEKMAMKWVRIKEPWAVKSTIEELIRQKQLAAE